MGNQHVVLGRHWGWGRSRITSCGPPHWCDARYASELSSRSPPVALWGPSAIRLQEVSADPGGGCLLWWGVPAYMALGPRLLPVSVSLCCFVSLVSLVWLFLWPFTTRLLCGISQARILERLAISFSMFCLFNVENLHIFHLIYFQLFFFVIVKHILHFFPPDLLYFSICCILWLSKIYFANSKESLVNFWVNLW